MILFIIHILMVASIMHMNVLFLQLLTMAKFTVLMTKYFGPKSGKAIPVEYTSTPVTENGLLIGAVVIFRDITERKAIQAKLLNALQEVDALKQRLEKENAYLLEELNADFNHHQIIGQSEKVRHMVNQIELVGQTDANVLITGESGTGKELIARYS